MVFVNYKYGPYRRELKEKMYVRLALKAKLRTAQTKQDRYAKQVNELQQRVESIEQEIDHMTKLAEEM